MGIKNRELSKVLPYHYIGYYNPVPELISIDFAKIEKEILNSYLNYSEIIEELWKFPERKYKMEDFVIAEQTISGNCGWYVHDRKNKNGGYLHKDLKFHGSTGHKDYYGYGNSPGYYSSKRKAEYYLRLFKEKRNMTEQVEITVKVNGVATPLHKISEQTLLTVRENSRPKKVPIVRVGNFPDSPDDRRLILKVPVGIDKYEGKIVAIDLRHPNRGICRSWSLSEDDATIDYKGIDFYDNIKTIE